MDVTCGWVEPGYYNITTDATPTTVFGCNFFTTTKTSTVTTKLPGEVPNWGPIGASIGAGVLYFLLVVGVTLLIVWYSLYEFPLLRT